MENPFETIRDVIVEYATDDVDPSTITLETNVKEDLGLDSLAVVEMILDVEMKFDIEIDDEEAEGMKTIGDIVKYVEGLDK